MLVQAPVLAGVLLTLLAPRSLAAGPHVIPFPGTPDAASQTPIILSSVTRADVRFVHVVGSRSGAHGGRLASLPADMGVSFQPAGRFIPGERVVVAAGLTSAAAGAAMGDPGARWLRFSFRVARSPGSGGSPAGLALRDREVSETADGPSRGAPPGTFNFRSQPGLHPPLVVLRSDHDQTAGDIFLTPGYFVTPPGRQVGPMIVNEQGRLVWFRPVPHSGEAYDLEVQRYRGRPVLTWWQSDYSHFLGTATDVIVNSSYRTVATLHAANGYVVNNHDFQITPQGTALVIAYVPVQENLTSVEGPSGGTVLDCVIQELDIRTNRLLWEWHALGHIPLTDSRVSPGAASASRPYDYFHLNSIQRLPGGSLLISARNTWGVYKISRSTGRVIWALGGRHPSFRMGPGTGFQWQHDASLHAGGLITLFDDAAVPRERSQSSAKELRLDVAGRLVSLVRRFTHAPPLLSGVYGSAQLLGGGNLFVGWGTEPFFSEYTPSGRQILDGEFALGVRSYRALRFRWSGRPMTRPSIAARRLGSVVKIYVSWNGATQVAAWRVLGGFGRGPLAPVGGTVAWSGFETVATRRSGPRYVAAQALDRHGHVLGISATVPVGS